MTGSRVETGAARTRRGCSVPRRYGMLPLALFLLPAGCGEDAPSPPETSVESGLIQAPGGPLYFEARGEGPAVVLLHGGNLDLRMWDPQVELLAHGPLRRRVVRYDIRPYGRSSPAIGPYADTDDLRHLLDHLEIEAATLVGLSLGGGVAVDFALAHPTRVSGLVLVGPGLSGYRFSRGEERSARFRAALERGGTEALVEEWLRDPYMAPAMEIPELAPTVRALAHDNRQAWLPENRPYAPTGIDPPAIQRLAEIFVPTLIVIGERDVPDIHAIVDLLEAGIPGAIRQMIPGVGHLPNLEAPEAFNQSLTSFLESREQMGREVGRGVAPSP